jgi:hypothetical protein
MIKTRWLWASFGRDVLLMKGWRLTIILLPRPDLSCEGSLVVGRHASLWFDAVDCSLRFDNIKPDWPRLLKLPPNVLADFQRRYVRMFEYGATAKDVEKALRGLAVLLR